MNFVLRLTSYRKKPVIATIAFMGVRSCEYPCLIAGSLFLLLKYHHETKRQTHTHCTRLTR